MTFREREDLMSFGQRFDMVFVDCLPSHDILPLVQTEGKLVVLEPVLRLKHQCLIEQNDLFDVYRKIQSE